MQRWDEQLEAVFGGEAEHEDHVVGVGGIGERREEALEATRGHQRQDPRRGRDQREPVGDAAWCVDERAGGRLELLGADREVQGPVEDVEGLVLAVVHVRRRCVVGCQAGDDQPECTAGALGVGKDLEPVVGGTGQERVAHVRLLRSCTGGSGARGAPSRSPLEDDWRHTSIRLGRRRDPVREGAWNSGSSGHSA
jgi:hypothetical protein